MTKSVKVSLNFLQKIAVLRRSLSRFPQKTKPFCLARAFFCKAFFAIEKSVLRFCATFSAEGVFRQAGQNYVLTRSSALFDYFAASGLN